MSNKGNATAGKNKLIWVLSTDSVIDASDLLIGKSKNVLKLGGGKSRKLKKSIRIPKSIIPGDYFLGAIVDSSDVIVESNETNNTAAVKIDIQAKK